MTFAGQPPSPDPSPPAAQARAPEVITEDMLESGEAAGARLDFERDMSYAPRVVLTLIAVNVLVFAWEVATGALVSRDAIIGAGALEASRVAHGEFWRLGSATFLHGSFGHLFGNMIMLYVAGMACEHAVGPGQTGTLYTVSALCGSALSTLTTPGPSVGASGAVFGLMAGAATFLVVQRDRIRLRDRRIALVLGVLIVWQILQGFLTPYVDNMAHIGGTVGGVVAMLVAKPVLLEGMAGGS